MTEQRRSIKSWTRQLQQLLTGTRDTGKNRRAFLLRDPFISIRSRSTIGAQVEVWFPHLPLDELDWDEAMYSLVGTAPR